MYSIVGIYKQSKLIYMQFFLVSSNVYGSSKERQFSLRLFDGNGLLKSFEDANGQELLPLNPEDEDCARDEAPYCFMAGKT